MLTLTPVKSYTFRIILFPLQLYTYFFGHLTQSCLASPYIPKSTFPLGMKLAFLAQKIFSDLVSLSFAGQTLLRIPSNNRSDYYTLMKLFLFFFGHVRQKKKDKFQFYYGMARLWNYGARKLGCTSIKYQQNEEESCALPSFISQTIFLPFRLLST